MPGSERPVGQLFTHVYCERKEPSSDSPTFRRRLYRYFETFINHDQYFELMKYVEMTSGIEIKKSEGLHGYYINFEKIIFDMEVRELLSFITLMWRYIKIKRGNAEANRWTSITSKILSEENMSYVVDDKGGIHYLVDSEFIHNNESTIKYLEDRRYLAVREAFESSRSHIESTPPETKYAVRSVFESLEILVKMMVDTSRLNRRTIESQLTEKITVCYSGNETAIQSANHALKGFACWVDGMHYYRHGQASEEPTEPPLDFAVYAVSSGASFLRWLLEIDAQLNS